LSKPRGTGTPRSVRNDTKPRDLPFVTKRHPLDPPTTMRTWRAPAGRIPLKHLTSIVPNVSGVERPF